MGWYVAAFIAGMVVGAFGIGIAKAWLAKLNP